MNKVAFHTFGCKLNYSETSTISRIFKKNGFKTTSIENKPDEVIINTCSVTENADKKCKDLIKKINKVSPKSNITVVGCYAQLKPKKISSFQGVKKVLGIKEKFEFLLCFADRKLRKVVKFDQTEMLSFFVLIKGEINHRKQENREKNRVNFPTPREKLRKFA